MHNILTRKKGHSYELGAICPNTAQKEWTQ